MISGLLEFLSPSEGFWHKTIFDPTIFWVFLTALATVALVIVGYYQLEELIQTRKAKHADQLRASFLTPKAIALLIIISRDFLIFIDDRNFGIEPANELAEESPKVRKYLQAGRIRTSEIMQRILNPLENIAFEVETNKLLFQHVEVLFGVTIITVWENEAIKQFIATFRKQTGIPEMYEWIEKLYARVKKRLGGKQ